MAEIKKTIDDHPPKIVALDGLRGVAFLIVVIASTIMYNMIEKRFMKMGNDIIKNNLKSK